MVKTMLPTSKPFTKYSTQEPKLPPPDHTSSINVISSLGILRPSISQLRLNSTHSSLKNVVSSVPG